VNRHFELPINWRIAKNSFLTPHSRIFLSDDYMMLKPESDLLVFLPHDYARDILAMRNWLHNLDNNMGGYVMWGCYQIDHAHKTTLIGIKFGFYQAIDAVYFRLFSSV
jgi:hypothetical protein